MNVRKIPGVELETAEVTLRLGRQALVRLTESPVECAGVWLSKQPDGSYALGLLTEGVAPAELGLQSRSAEHFGPIPPVDDDFPDHDLGDEGDEVER